MIKENLHSGWKFRQVGTEDWYPAEVPGGVHTDLMASGLLPDPFIGDNEYQAMWVAEKDWEYKLTFQPQRNLLNEDRIFLVADGLDTLGEVFLNGTCVGRVGNQFRQWIWEISDLLVNGNNTLHILFYGPTTYAGKGQMRRRLKGVSQAIDGGPHLRKAPCQFGWDWGPMLPPIGIWKSIRLEGRSVGKIRDTHFRQFHENGTVTISGDVEVENWGNCDLKAVVSILTPEEEVIEIEKKVLNGKLTLDIKIEHPLLWWPNGYGPHNIYMITTSLIHDSNVIDQETINYGLRTIELVQENDQFGKSFQFVINGIPVFVKGSNWIPADSFITRFTDERLEKLISDAAISHQNMLRVWGGGFYEEERFYNLCDQYGIMVWQDFVFSCSIYPLDEEEFLENVRIEIIENVKRIRHRASLALWCGNNEMAWGWVDWGWQEFPMEERLPALIEQFPQLGFLMDLLGERDLLPDWQVLKDAYDHFFHTQLPNWILDLDPDTAYWPSSPSSNIPFHDPNSQEMGDAHFWDVWHGRKPFTAYRDSFPRFMSEFGFQAFPTIETIDFYTTPEDRNLTSYVMEHHQRGNHGNGLIISQMTDTFRMPKNFYSWIYLSNILQAEGIRYGVEHWRRNMDRVSGTLYWQLNDCWPVASWSSIDYFGRWKALHYAAKKFYSPLLLSIEDRPPEMDVHISSDSTEEVMVNVKWSLEKFDGEKIEFGNIETSIKPLTNSLIKNFNFTEVIKKHNHREIIFICELWQDGIHLSTSVATFVPNKHLDLSSPGLSITSQSENSDFVFTLEAASLARFVEMKITDHDVVFSDNYFDLPAGRKKSVRCRIPHGVSLDDLNGLLVTFTLYDSYSS